MNEEREYDEDGYPMPTEAELDAATESGRDIWAQSINQHVEGTMDAQHVSTESPEQFAERMKLHIRGTALAEAIKTIEMRRTTAMPAYTDPAEVLSVAAEYETWLSR